MGKRMNSSLPKVLHPLGGKALLARVVDSARSLSPSRLCVVYGHGGDMVPQALVGNDLAFALQEPQLGTGHAVMQALPHLDDNLPTLVLYGDVPLTRGSTLQRLLDSAGSEKLSILTVELDQPKGYGRIVREDGRIRRIVEEKDATPAERTIAEVNTGIMVIPPKRLSAWLARLSNQNAQGEYYLTDVVAQAVADGVEVVSARPDTVWETLGVNSKTQLAELERILQKEQAASLLEQGVTLADPQRIDIRGSLKCGRDVSIDVNCVFEGEVVLADGVSIGPHCVLKDVQVQAGAAIKAFCHLEDAVVGAQSLVGPYARLRPGAQLGREVHIGNFVEVKNSSIADYSKANHLAYVGDSQVGSRVNIGAGVITVNYDGVNKHKTIIEDDAFVGSDSMLVAPVTVGRGANIAAGSTITRDAPPGKLTIARARQVVIEGWKRPVKKTKPE